MNIVTSTSAVYETYVDQMKEIADIRYAAAVLQWDQETYMPSAGSDTRARQIATLSEIAHERFTSSKMGDLLRALQQSNLPDENQRVNIERSLYDYNQQTRLPAAHVRQLSEASSRAFHTWMEARKENAFTPFIPSLEALCGLKIKEAGLLGFEAHPYDALLNEYERGATTVMLDQVFSELQVPLKNLIDEIGKKEQVDDSLLFQFYPDADQWEFGMALLQRMGYDLTAGRQDRAEHPFTTNFSNRDVRITTRVDEQDLGNMTWSTIHELGHALYEQGLPGSEYGLPLGEYASLSIHESQSRLWENNVGRSLAWCKCFMPLLQEYFPEQLKDVSPSHFYRVINRVAPSLIRTEADELTYHFHVIIRYELEKALINEDLKVKDIPEYWNQQYQHYLGIPVPDDRNGSLQDVHWSHGSFGYFPTYSLGSLYAAQFFHAATIALPGLDQQLSEGNFGMLLQWLRDNIHCHGRKYTSEELCEKITGEGINIRHFMQYSINKYRLIYAFQPGEV